MLQVRRSERTLSVERECQRFIHDPPLEAVLVDAPRGGALVICWSRAFMPMRVMTTGHFCLADLPYRCTGIPVPVTVHTEVLNFSKILPVGELLPGGLPVKF
jgi:hypothetical protein